MAALLTRISIRPKCGYALHHSVHLRAIGNIHLEHRCRHAASLKRSAREYRSARQQSLRHDSREHVRFRGRCRSRLPLRSRLFRRASCERTLQLFERDQFRWMPFRRRGNRVRILKSIARYKADYSLIAYSPFRCARSAAGEGRGARRLAVDTLFSSIMRCASKTSSSGTAYPVPPLRRSNCSASDASISKVPQAR